MKIVNKKINDLNFAEYNPRELTKEQFAELKESVEKFGLVDPIIINRNISLPLISKNYRLCIFFCKHFTSSYLIQFMEIAYVSIM